MTKNSIVQQFDECISSLEEEIALIEGGSCDDATLDKMSAYAIKPEYQSTVGKYCSFPSLSDFLIPPEPLTPIPSTTDKETPEKGSEKRRGRKRKGETSDQSSTTNTPVKPQSPRRSKRAKKD